MSIEHVLSAVAIDGEACGLIPLQKLLLIELARMATPTGGFVVDLETHGRHIKLGASFAREMLQDLQALGWLTLQKETRVDAKGKAQEVLAYGTLRLPALSWGHKGGAA